MVAVDRFEEFTEIILNSISKTEHSEDEPILRNRKRQNNNELKNFDDLNNLFTFSKSFLSECTLINSTLIQLNEKIKKISQKSDQISFSFSGPTSPRSDPTSSVEEALNICSMNISVLKKRLIDKENGESSAGVKTESKGFLSSWFNNQKNTIHKQSHPIMEHCKLVLSFLENRVGRITEDLETFKTRKKNRESLLNPITSGIKKTSISNNSNSNSNSSLRSTSNSDNGQQLEMLQVENSRMIEEMSRGLFETLSSTESQVLEIARLQSTLQSHLTVQHDLTCRLFEDSLTTVEDTRKGNEYLKKSGKDGSVMRKFLVTLMLGMSLLLLLLHYFNK